MVALWLVTTTLLRLEVYTFVIISSTNDPYYYFYVFVYVFPSESELDEKIIDHFCKHQDELISLIQKTPAGMNLDKTIITSPLLSFVTYSLDDCLTIFEVHGERHFEQAKRVANLADFPR